MKKHIHFTGIKGVGMTPLAIIAKEAGFVVTGSDVGDTFITDQALEKAGITPFVGFDASHIEGADLMIATGAHGGYNNMEVQVAKDRKIPVLMQGQAVGEFMNGRILGKEFTGISVAGSHGKTTTTAMIATLLKELKVDPSYVVGTSALIPLGLPGHLGKGAYFVAEADEYATDLQYDKTAKFMWQKPKIAVITNIELDHTDLYPDIESIETAFSGLIRQLPEDGVLIACGDSESVRHILQNYEGRVITYGFSKTNEYVLTRTSASGSQTFFWVTTQGTTLGEFVISVSGEHNALNGLATILVGIELGFTPEQIKTALKAFRGSKRRLEYRGKLVTGAEVYDDYAHHPTEIQKSLKALRGQYGRKKLIAVFQPHTYSRTKMLLSDFSRSFSDAETVVFMDIYASLREVADPSFSIQLLIDETKKHTRNVEFKPTQSDVVQYLNDLKLKDDTILVCMGAGDIYKVIDHLELRKT